MNIREYKDLVHQHTDGFNPSEAIDNINRWLDDYMKESGMKKAVIGISGGKDSTIVAKLLVDKMGKDNVLGLLMPNGEQKDISDSLRVVDILGMRYETININSAYNAMLNILGEENVSDEARINIAPRIRMTMLYTYGQTHGCRVAGTGNLSERMVGYTTKFGDNASDFNIIGNYTSLEVMRIGEELGLPLELVYKTPADGLTGLSDEEKLGVTYIDIHNFIRHKFEEVGLKVGDRIYKMIEYSKHKRKLVPIVPYHPEHED